MALGFSQITKRQRGYKNRPQSTTCPEASAQLLQLSNLELSGQSTEEETRYAGVSSSVTPAAFEMLVATRRAVLALAKVPSTRSAFSHRGIGRATPARIRTPDARAHLLHSIP
jgi:hypothetical protein